MISNIIIKNTTINMSQSIGKIIQVIGPVVDVSFDEEGSGTAGNLMMR